MNITTLLHLLSRTSYLIARALSFASLALLLTLVSTQPTALAQSEAVAEIIRLQVEQIRTARTLQIGDARIASIQVLPELYERRRFTPVWHNRNAIDDLLRALKDSAQDGLDPDDYHLTSLQQLEQILATTESSDPVDLASFDLLLSDALIRLSYHLLFGKVDPQKLDSNWNLIRRLNDIDPAQVIQQAIDSGKLYQAIENLKPQHYFYTRLKTALARYREIQTLDGWPIIPKGETLKPGMTDERIPLLRLRLAISGDLTTDELLTSAEFDSQLEAAVRHFQQRHHLEEDGVIGVNTLTALNVPVTQRIEQIRVNLERGRWVLHGLQNTFLVVNIAGFKVYLIRDNTLIWETRAVVGSNYHKSPVFSADMKFLVFNPTWTIPHSIAEMIT